MEGSIETDQAGITEESLQPKLAPMLRTQMFLVVALLGALQAAGG
ncbi:MAG: hypothetical protein ACJ0S4_01865 [Candidatus Rariloculaceae bacterium]